MIEKLSFYYIACYATYIILFIITMTIYAILAKKYQHMEY